MKSLDYQPIGHFRCENQYKYEAPRQPSDDETESLGEVRLVQGFNFGQALQGIEGFERLWLIYELHKNLNWKTMTRTPRATPKQGVFATRSPYRPNPIGLSCVKLVEVKNLKLIVKEFDLLDRTPILDIKPYIPSCDRFNVQNASWVEQEKEKDVEFSDLAEEQIRWLKQNGVSQIKAFLVDQLKRDPVNATKKRILQLSQNEYRIAYRTWRADFEFDSKVGLCKVKSLQTGYSYQDFLDPQDKYQNKTLHKTFMSHFYPDQA